ncbi:MAG TPA: SDR family NAD(P)-dependent oxidoreductase [Actinocrinis sp.]|uniref:SDR family NAD(P)-dependent oxidoreductase n=1 Tax=Actinocrinis sp. TaxID=1920516 RepID=UPI002DDCBA2F|nr:SDR family NAD(P)-dependent oxidoreductase [Actinocrinis sp.]HEV3173604.1 SDR family NAD(P)-dependent oxidoreductase [Actinocrinis sp.]
MDRYDFSVGTAIVTGAAGGIGEQLAYALARRGSALALVDRDAERLEQVAKQVRELGEHAVTTYVVDLADDEAAHALGRGLASEHPDATLLINNAGVALGGTFEQVSEEEFDWLLAINLRAVITLTRELLPTLRANPGSHLVNMSSLFGLIAPAGQVAYSTSKFAVRGFTEALRAELVGSVGVTSVHPGGIRTGIALNARLAASVAGPEAEEERDTFAALLTYSPEKAAAQIVAAIEHRRPRLLIALSARIPDLIVRLAPAHYPAVVAAVQRLVGRPR